MIFIMIRRSFLLGLVFGLLSQICNAQISFIGFEQEQCGLITNHGYTYENIPWMCGDHSSGYKIYLDGERIFEKCIEYGGCSVLDIMFINETTGFIVERDYNGHTIYKTENSGLEWSSIGEGAPTYLGFYLVNANTGYLITTWNTPFNLYISRVSDIKKRRFDDPNINQDIIIYDTIFGESFCGYDSLNFKVKNSADTINYKISFLIEPLSIRDVRLSEEIVIYPIPCTDFISIQKELQINNIFKYEITDMTGRLIKSDFLIDNQIYIGDLKNGFYLIEFHDKNKRLTGKILKQ